MRTIKTIVIQKRNHGRMLMTKRTIGKEILNKAIKAAKEMKETWGSAVGPYHSSWWEGVNQSEIDKAVSSLGADLRLERRRTILMMAARYGTANHIRTLLSAGSEVNDQDASGWTALMWATRSEKLENIEALLVAGADRALKDKGGRTAFDYAKLSAELRGTDLYWSLMNDPDAHQKSLVDTIHEILQYPDYGPTDIIIASTPIIYAKLTILFDDKMSPLIVEKASLDQLRCGLVDRIIGAKINESCLLAIRIQDVTELRTLQDVIEELDGQEIIMTARKFMRDRTKPGPPYFQAFGIPYSRIDEIHPFAIYKDHKLIGRSIEALWGAGVYVRDKERQLSVKFSDPIGFYISKEDERLIFCWSGQINDLGRGEIISRSTMKINDTHRKFNRLVHARLAEKLAVSLYASISDAPVQDCSIEQLNGDEGPWRNYDLWARGPIDVKNATIYRGNTRQNYVPKFKRSAGRDVRISAFATSLVLRGGIEQIFLGEVSAPEIASAKRAVERVFPALGATQIHFDENYLPAWVFEYPHNAIDYNELLNAYYLLARRPESILAAGIAAGKAQSLPVYSRLKETQRKIVDRLTEAIHESSYSKRTLVLFAISGFAEEVIAGKDARRFVSFFRKLLSMEELGVGEGIRRVGSRVIPEFHGSFSGGLVDPLNSVFTIFDLLERAANGIIASGCVFQSFHAANPHILLGRLKSGEKVTIYSYCGGRTVRGAACDTFPLIIGMNKTCNECGKLICHECGFCCSDCSSDKRDI